MMHNIYLDHAATTPLLSEVADVMDSVNRDRFYNPSALYTPSLDLSYALKDAKKVVANSLHVPSDELYFTSSATEANNTIIQGSIDRSHGDFNVVTSAIEHPSVMQVFKHFKDRGVDVRFVPVDEHGRLDYDWLRENVDEKTSLVSLMGVNNELGSITDLTTVRKIIDKNAPQAMFHTDYVQAFLKSKDSRLDLRKAKPEALTVTAHKINGPKGIGAMYIKRNSKVSPLLFGGGQESGFRPGTENTAGIFGFAEAIKYHQPRLEESEDYLSDLRSYLVDGLESISDVVINSPDDGIANLLSISALGVKSQVVLHMLSLKGIYIAVGSACSSRHQSDSYVHRALGYDSIRSDGTIRISMDVENTREDIDVLLTELKTSIEEVRKVSSFAR